MADRRAKALAYLSAGQVRVHTAATPPGAALPVLVVAAVFGHTGRHTVAYDVTQEPHRRWTCTCWQVTGCAHAAAVAQVTGFPHLAAREDATSPRST